MEIVPTILEKTAVNFLYQLKKLSLFFSHFQIDIGDGLLTPNKTIQIDELAAVFQQLNHETMKPLIFDFHLMVKDYENEIKKLLVKNSLKIGSIFIHSSLSPNYLSLTTNCPFPIGLVLTLEDQVSDLVKKYDLNRIQSIQIMTVKLGFQGTPFFPQALKKIGQLREAGYQNKIFIDGGVNEKTLPVIVSNKFQPDIVGVGSYFTHASQQELEKKVAYLYRLLL